MADNFFDQFDTPGQAAARSVESPASASAPAAPAAEKPSVAAGTPENPNAAPDANASWSIGKQLVDLIRSVPGIAQDAANAVTGGTLDLAGTVQQGVDTAMGRSADVKAQHMAETKSLQHTLDFHAVADASTVLGGVTRGIGKWIAIGALAPEVAGGTLAAKAAVNFGVGFVATNPEEKNLSNLLRDYTGLNDPITEFMAADKNSPAIVNRLRGGLENTLTMGLVDATMAKLKGIKAARALEAAGDKKGAAEVMAKANAEAVTLAAEGSAKPQDISIFPHEPTVYADTNGVVHNAKPVTAAEAAAGVNPDLVGHGGAEMRPAAAVKADLAAGDAALSSAPKVAEAGASPAVQEGVQLVEATGIPLKGAPNVSTMDNKVEPMVRLFRQSTPEGMTASPFTNWGLSEGAVQMFQHKGSKLYSMDIPASKLEGFRKSNILANPIADEALKARIATEGGMPGQEFLLPKALASTAVEHLDPLKGLGTLEMKRAALDAAVQKSNPEAWTQEIRMTISKGQDGAVPNIEGVINWGRIAKDEDVGKMLNDMAAVAGKDHADIAGTYQSFSTIKGIATKIGQDPAELLSRLNVVHAQTKNMGSLLLAGDALMERTASDARLIVDKLLGGKGTDADKVMLAKMSDILMSTMDHVSGIQTAGARATAARRIRVTEAITDKNFASLLEKVGGDEGVMALAARIRAASDTKGVIGAVKYTPSIPKMITEAHNFGWMNSILSSIKTAVVNPVTTALQTAAMPGYRIVGGLVDVALGNKQGWDQTMRGVQQYKYMSQTFADAWQFAKKSWVDNESVLIPQANPLEHVGAQAPIDAKYFAQHLAGEQPNALGRAALGVDKTIENLTGVKEGIGWLGTIVGAPGRFLTSEDEFFKQIAYRSHVMTEAHMDGLAQGMDGSVLESFVKSKLLDSLDTAGHAINKDGIDAAKAATFTQDLKTASYLGETTLGEIASNAAQKSSIVRAIIPFTKVPTNLYRNFIDLTPGINMLRKQNYLDLMAGGEKRAMMLGKMGVGGMLWGTAITAASNGYITGSGPADPELRKQMGPTWQPYSAYVGTFNGQPRYVSFSRLDPIGMIFGLAADIHDIRGEMPSEDSMTNSIGYWAGALVPALAKNLSSKTYLKGLVDAGAAFSSGDEKKVERWMAQRLASYVPGILQPVTQGFDNEIKDVRGMLDNFKSRIPGWSKTVEARRDNFGEKVMPPQGYPWDAINPFTFFTGSVDPVRQELAGLAQINSAAKFPVPSPTYPEGSRESSHLDLRSIPSQDGKGQSAYDRWMELHKDFQMDGKTLHESMAELIASPEYKDARAKLGDGDMTYGESYATFQIRKRFDMYKKATWQALLDDPNFPGLRQATEQLRLGGKTTKFEGSGTATPIDQIRDIAAGQQ